MIVHETSIDRAVFDSNMQKRELYPKLRLYYVNSTKKKTSQIPYTIALPKASDDSITAVEVMNFGGLLLIEM